VRSARSAANPNTSSGRRKAMKIVVSLLEEVENEEVLLRDYVLGVGYQ
jgi:hypothetical protein